MNVPAERAPAPGAWALGQIEHLSRVFANGCVAARDEPMTAPCARPPLSQSRQPLSRCGGARQRRRGHPRALRGSTSIITSGILG